MSSLLFGRGIQIHTGMVVETAIFILVSSVTVAHYICLFPSTSTHVLTEDVVYREVTADHRLLSRRLLMKTNRLPRWAERFFPSGMSRCVFIVEDSIVDPVGRTLTTYTWNLNHTTLMVRRRLLPSPFESMLGSSNITDVQI